MWLLRQVVLLLLFITFHAVIQPPDPQDLHSGNDDVMRTAGVIRDQTRPDTTSEMVRATGEMVGTTGRWWGSSVGMVRTTGEMVGTTGRWWGPRGDGGDHGEVVGIIGGDDGDHRWG